MTSSRAKVGVVGAGYWGPNLIRNAAQLGVLDSVCDTDAAALAAVNVEYPSVATLSSFDRLLQRPIDAVIIATPAQTHATMVREALARGKHVFVEKPLALTIPDGEEIVRLATVANRQVFVGHLLLYHPAVVRLRSLMREDRIGHVWHVRSRRLSLGKLRRHESVWWSFAPHDVALILALMEAEPLSVTAAQTAIRRPGSCDVAYADYVFSGGRSAHIEVSWLDPNKNARLDVFGTTGVLSLTDTRQGATLHLTPCGAAANDSVDTWRKEPETISFNAVEPLRAELEAFLESISTGIAPQTDAREGVAVLRALRMADEAALRAVTGVTEAV